MAIIGTRKWIKEEAKVCRDTTIDVVGLTLDELVKCEGTEEQRKKLAEAAKASLESQAAVEESRADCEFSAGQVSGFFKCIGAQVIGGLIGMGIGCIIQKANAK